MAVTGGDYGGQAALDKLIQLVKSALRTKVDKEEGKGLSSNDYTYNEKQKLAGIADNAEVNVQSDWNETNTEADGFIKNKPTIPTVPTKLSELQNDSQYIREEDVTRAIASAVGGIYKPKGSTTFANLPAPSAANLGFVYNVTDAFTTTAAFMEGSGVHYSAGTNVVCVETGPNTYAWDVLGSAFDLEEITAAEVQALWDSN